MIDKPCSYIDSSNTNQVRRGVVRAVGWTSAGASLVVEVEGGKLVEVTARLVTVTPQLESFAEKRIFAAYSELRHVSRLLLDLTPSSKMADLSALASILQKRLEDARMILWPTDSRIGQ